MNTKIRAWLPVLLWAAVIFVFSAMPAEISAGQSGTLTEAIIAVVDLVTGQETADAVSAARLETLLRKSAHFLEYLILAVLVHRALRMRGARRPFVYALPICLALAAADELHQIFVPGRAAMVTDVLLDMAGATAGLAVGKLRGRAIPRGWNID